MIMRVTADRFVDAFKGLNGWSDTFKNNYSFEGLLELFGYLDHYYINDEKETFLDRVMIADEFKEYASLEEFNKDYSGDFETIEELKNKTLVLKITKISLGKNNEAVRNLDSFIIRAY